MSLVKNSIAALAVAATVGVPMATSAQAGDRGWSRHDGQRGYVSCGPRDRNCDGIIDRGVRIQRGQKRNTISGSDAAGIAVLGIIGGAIIGSAIANQNQQPRYVRPAPQPTYQYRDRNAYPVAPRRAEPRVVEYSGSYEPWSRGWYQYCDAKYRSFNPQKGTYRGYDGQDHFCVAK